MIDCTWIWSHNHANFLHDVRGSGIISTVSTPMCWIYHFAGFSPLYYGRHLAINQAMVSFPVRDLRPTERATYVRVS